MHQQNPIFPSRKGDLRYQPGSHRRTSFPRPASCPPEEGSSQPGGITAMPARPAAPSPPTHAPHCPNTRCVRTRGCRAGPSQLPGSSGTAGAAASPRAAPREGRAGQGRAAAARDSRRGGGGRQVHVFGSVVELLGVAVGGHGGAGPHRAGPSSRQHNAAGPRPRPGRTGRAGGGRAALARAKAEPPLAGRK